MTDNTPVIASTPATPASKRKGKTPAAWAKLIRADLQQAVEGIIKAGKHLIEAKADVGHGNFDAWVEKEVKISRQSAWRLMSIAQHPALSNVAHVQHLPTSWGTLAELARIPAPALEAKIKDGSIFPDMERKDATKLVRLVENEGTGAPVSSGSSGGGGSRASSSSGSHSVPVLDFRTFADQLINLDPQKLVDTEVDQDGMRGHLDLLSDWIEAVRKLLG